MYVLDMHERRGMGEVADGAAVETGGPTAEISACLHAAFNLSDGH